MQVKIPKSFELGGSKITIEYADLIANDTSVDGYAEYDKCKITLKNTNKGDYANFVFYHEMIHMILHQMSNELRGDENFVNQFATFLHQAIKSQELDN